MTSADIRIQNLYDARRKRAEVDEVDEDTLESFYDTDGVTIIVREKEQPR